MMSTKEDCWLENVLVIESRPEEANAGCLGKDKNRSIYALHSCLYILLRVRRVAGKTEDATVRAWAACYSGSGGRRPVAAAHSTARTAEASCKSRVKHISALVVLKDRSRSTIRDRAEKVGSPTCDGQGSAISRFQYRCRDKFW